MNTGTTIKALGLLLTLLCCFLVHVSSHHPDPNLGSQCTPSSFEATQVCAGDSSTIIVNDLTAVSTYSILFEVLDDSVQLLEFSLVGSTDIGGVFSGKSPAFPANFNQKTLRIVSVSNTSNAPCGQTFANEYTQSLEVITLTPQFTENPSIACLGSEQNFTLSENYFSYTWNFSSEGGNPSIISGGTDSVNFANVLWDIAQTGTAIVSVSVTDLNGCQGSRIDSFDLSLAPFLISQNDTVCQGDLVDLTVLVDDTTNSDGFFTIFGNFTDAQNDENALPSSIVFPDTTTRYFIRKNVGACFDIDSLTITVAGTSPILNTNDPSICAGEPVDLLDFVSDDANVEGNYSFYFSEEDAETENNPFNGSIISPAENISFFARKNASGGCFDISEISVFVSESPEVSFLQSPPYIYCPDTGQVVIEALPFGGTWSGSIGINGNFDLSQSPGDYLAQYTYVDSLTGCADSTSINLNILPAPQLSIEEKIEPDCSADNGSVLLNANGGLAPYVFSIDNENFLPNPRFDQLPAGVFTFYVRDSNNCISLLTDSLEIPNGPTATVNILSPVLCRGDSSGGLQINVSNGIPPYSYSLNNGDTTSQNTFEGLVAGTYTILIRDAENCSFSLQTEITQPDTALTLSNIFEKAPDCNQNNGQVTLEALGGTAPYIFSNNGFVSGQNSNEFFSLNAGVQAFYVRDANGCEDSLNIVLDDVCCPSFQGIGATKEQFCENEQSRLIATLLDDDGGELIWQQVFQNGQAPQSINSPDSLQFSLGDCLDSTVLIRALFVPIKESCDTVFSDTLRLDIYPEITANLVELSDCEVQVETICEDYVVSWTDNLGNSGNSLNYLAGVGTTGKVDFLITNPNAPSGIDCQELALSWEFLCNGGECAIRSVDVGEQFGCSPDSNGYGQTLTLTYQNAPANGSLIVNGQEFPIEGSPQSLILQNLPADGQWVDIEAYFSEKADCRFVLNNAFFAPPPCGEISCAATTSAGQTFVLNLEGFPLEIDSLYTFNADGGLLVNSNGTAFINGTLINQSDSSAQWYVNLKLFKPFDWTVWSAIGRTYRADSASADLATAEAFHPFWRYWEIDASKSEFLGIGGAVNGLSLRIDNDFGTTGLGTQLGFGADNASSAYGLSSDFTWQGRVNGEEFVGSGGMRMQINCNDPLGDMLPQSFWESVSINGESLIPPFKNRFELEEESSLQMKVQLIERESQVNYEINGFPDTVIVQETGGGKRLTLDIAWQSQAGSAGSYPIELIKKNALGQENKRLWQLEVAPLGSYPSALLYFSAIAVGERDVEVAWETSAEFDGTLFLVERSFDGEFFVNIADINGRGNLGAGLQEYSYRDNNVQNAIAYYRLKQIAPNGAFLFSQVVEVNFDATEEVDFLIFPNPATETLQLRVPILVEGTFTIQIMDSRGRILLEEFENLRPGYFVKELPILSFRNALYLIRVIGPNMDAVKRFSKL